MTQLPKHIAFIMDGNGRWAQTRNLPRSQGHKEGVSVAANVVDYCIDIGIEYVSFFVFSTENWKRPKTEIDTLFSLAEKYLDKYDDNKRDIRVVCLGTRGNLPKRLVDKIEKVVESTKNNKKCTVNLCLNYGGRAEIVSTANLLAKQNKKITLEAFEREIYGVLPPVDYIVRTGGEMRLSNFMLYQSAYAELYFTDLFWPDFDIQAFDGCIEQFKKRKRNFGGLKNG